MQHQAAIDRSPFRQVRLKDQRELFIYTQPILDASEADHFIDTRSGWRIPNIKKREIYQ
jgi:hypothetical protein